MKRFVLASALDSVAAAAAKVRADGIDAQFELATGLDGSLASAAAVRIEALAKLSAARLDKLDEQYGAQEQLDRAVTVASTYAATAVTVASTYAATAIEKAPRYVENVTTDPRGAALALKAYAGASLARVGSRASSLAVSVLGEGAVEDAGTALASVFPESHRPEAKTLATSVALGLGGLAVGVPFVPGITDNLLVGGVGAALPFLSGEEND